MNLRKVSSYGGGSLRMIRVRFGRLALAAVVSLIVAGCARKLPYVRGEYIQSRAQTIPQGATPVFSWQGAQGVIFTYWGRQSATVRVRAWVPTGATAASDARWEVDARTGEGKPLPFIGVEKSYLNERGQEVAKLVPPLDLDRMPDGLYVVISPGMEFAQGKLSRIQPIANVREIRHKTITPLCFPVLLIPDAPSDLVPVPPPRPEEPEGTALPN